MFATLSDVQARLGRPITDQAEVDQVNAWIADTDVLIRARVPDIDERVAAGTPPATTMTMVVANVVIRKLKNPDGKVQEGLDDYNYRLNENARRGELFLTDEEWSLILSTPSGAFSVRPFFEPDVPTTLETL